jgi:hypothetical protein
MNYPGVPTPTEQLANPSFDGVAIRGDIGGRLDRIGAEQLSRSAQQRTHFIQLLLQPRISHTLTLPRCRYPHNSPAVFHQRQRRRDTADNGRLGRWQSSVGIRRVSASGELPKNH